MMDPTRSHETPSCSAIDLAEIRQSSKIIDNRTFNAEFKYVGSISPHPPFFCDSQVKYERNVYIYILHALFTLLKM